MTTPGIPNDYTLSTTCFGTRLPAIQDQVFAAVGMGFRRIELGLAESPPSMEGLPDSQRETGIAIPSMMIGCRDPLNCSMAFERLGSLLPEECERAMNSVRRHVRLAKSWSCPVVVVRGARIEDEAMRAEARELEARILRGAALGEDGSPHEAVQAFVRRVQRKGQRQIEQFCRSLFSLHAEDPEVSFAIEPGRRLDDLLGFEALGWVLGDLASSAVGYWHDVGPIHLRERQGLEGQGAFLDAYAARMRGVHLQDAADDEIELPLGFGEVDFRLLREYVPAEAERVVEIGPRHGRAAILTSVQYLVDLGF